MISCSKDILTISPALTRSEILGKLAVCAEQYVASWLPRILSADLPATLEVLLAKDYTWLSAGQKERVRKEIGDATASEIEKRFREMVAVRIQRCPGPDIQIEFRKTLRVPDDGKTYPLPPGLGSFPIENLAHHAERIPASWGELGGVLVPMHQSEAMWLDFDGDWPTALKIGTGTVNSINGRNWTGGLIREPQGYVVLPEQPWLDGYCAAPGVVRQFVATSLGKGQSAEEQTLGTMRGGLQLEAFPLKVESYFEKKLRASLPRTAEDLVADYLPNGEGGAICSQSPCQLMESMGLGAGGRIKQEIYEDQWEPQDWDLTRPSRTWVHLVDAGVWKVVTGKTAPGRPLTAKEYNKHGFPWFDYCRDDMEPLKGSEVLANLKSVFDPLSGNGKSQGPDDGGFTGIRVKAIGPDVPTDRVKEWDGTVGEQDDQSAKPSVPLDQDQSMKVQKRLERQRANAATNRIMLCLVSCGVTALLVWIYFMGQPEKPSRELARAASEESVRPVVPMPNLQKKTPGDGDENPLTERNDAAHKTELDTRQGAKEEWQTVAMGEIAAQFPTALQDHPLSIPDGFGIALSMLECKQAKWNGVHIGFTRAVYRDVNASVDSGIDNSLRSFRTDPKVIQFISSTEDFPMDGYAAKRTKATFTVDGRPFELGMVSIANGAEIWSVLVAGPSPEAGPLALRVFISLKTKGGDLIKPIQEGESSRAGASEGKTSELLQVDNAEWDKYEAQAAELYPQATDENGLFRKKMLEIYGALKGANNTLIYRPECTLRIAQMAAAELGIAPTIPKSSKPSVTAPPPPPASLEIRTRNPAPRPVVPAQALRPLPDRYYEDEDQAEFDHMQEQAELRRMRDQQDAIQRDLDRIRRSQPPNYPPHPSSASVPLKTKQGMHSLRHQH